MTDNIATAAKKKAPAAPAKAVGPSPSIHPLIYSRDEDLMKGSPLSETAYAATVMALTHATETLHEVAEAENAIVDDELPKTAGRSGIDGYKGDVHTVNGHPRAFSHRYNEFTDAAEGALDSAISKVEAQHKTVLNTALQMNKGLEKHLYCAKTARNPEMAVQIRDRLSQMTPQKAMVFAMQRVQAGDSATIHAVFHSPAWLSGLKDDANARLRPLAYQALDQQGYERMTTADRMTDTLNLALTSLRKRKVQVARYRQQAEKKASVSVVI